MSSLECGFSPKTGFVTGSKGGKRGKSVETEALDVTNMTSSTVN